ncbi:hypothetical protein EHQ72_03605, partial [Leptospira yasudae]
MTFASQKPGNAYETFPGKKEYSEPSEIRIENGKIASIKKINSFSGKVSYALPGFCDANVTLSTDSLGG